MENHYRWLIPTPVQYLGRLPGGQDLFIKRDDLLGFSFGGNKCRIAVSFLEDMEHAGADFMVSYGSRRSNLNRVIAALCSSRKIPCLIITAEDGEEGANFNSVITDSMGIKRVVCKKNAVAATVAETLDDLKRRGFKPYYIYGDIYGKGNEAAARNAYHQAYREIVSWERQSGIGLDMIFHASGTGMTQGGLLAGRRAMGGRETIVGISVARESEPGTAAVRRYAGFDDEDICFETGYRCGGYGNYDSDIEAVIQMMTERHGIALDPTYTGKAYSGMMKWLAQNGTGGEKVLFIHTGGLPLYFDYLNTKRGVTF